MMTLFAVALFAAGGPQGVVWKPVANMYSKPTAEADVVSQAIYGANVGLLEEKDGWARVRTPDDYTGWMPREWLKPGEPYAVQGRVGSVKSLFAHLYREADVTKHEPVITVPFETRLEIAAEPPNQERWLQARLPDGRSAWVQRGDLSFDTRPFGINEMIALSKRFLGLPYTWGGTSSFGYDCSGFVQMLYRQHGIVLPRDAGPQARWSGMLPVEKSEIQPGDLLYLARRLEQVTHTGFYMGGGKFINATTYQTPMVRIDDLGDAHWSALLVACRRPK